MDAPYPTRIELYYSDLPKESRDRIVALGKAPGDVRRVSNPAPTGILLGVLALGFLILLKFQSVTPLIFMLGAAIGWIIGTRVIAPNVTFSPYHYLHSSFILDAGYGLLIAYPIWHLGEIKIQHNLRNGSYQHSDVKFSFGTDEISMVAQSQEQAQSLARLAGLHRDSALKLLSLDSMTSIEGYDLIPGSAIKPGKKTSKTWLVLGVAVVAGLIASAILSNFVPYQLR